MGFVINVVSFCSWGAFVSFVDFSFVQLPIGGV